MERYDAVVVGGGLGGLSAAATLARAGLCVRLFERHSRPGGYATTFDRDRFEFEVSLHELSGVGTPERPGPLHEVLAELGVASRLEFLHLQDLFRTVGPGLDIRVPATPTGARDVLCEAFPRERRGIERLLEQCFAFQEEAMAATAGDDAPTPGQVIARYPNLAHAAGVSLATLLDRELRDPLARMALGQMWSYYGLPPSRLSLLLYGAGLATYLGHGATYIRGKSQALSDALAQAVRNAGGVVSLGQGVSRIRTGNGQVRGVVTERGEEVMTEFVVSNADPITTCTRLVAPEEVPRAFLKRLGSCRPSLSTFCVYLGLHRTVEELGIEDHEVFVNGTADLEAQYRACFSLEAPSSYLICSYSASDPQFAPPGASVVALVTLADGRTWGRIPPQQYSSVKMRFARQLMERAEQIVPGLRESVETVVVSTPLTNMRYTGNTDGAVYGFANTPPENPGLRLDQRGPLEGLWFAGAWTQPGGGFQQVVSSGVAAGRSILRQRSGEGLE